MGEIGRIDEWNEFKIGDVVWGKVKTHPWWPGVIFNEALASPLARDSKKEGHLLVAFFGDGTYKWIKPEELVSFEDHYDEMSKQTETRGFSKAVGEALAEVMRRAALGLVCHCRYPSNFRPTNVQGFVEVDVSGYETGGLYSTDQIERAREDFSPSETLSFVKQLAINPKLDAQRTIDCLRNSAVLLAYRKATFSEFDETYAQVFGVQSSDSGVSMANSSTIGLSMARASLKGQFARGKIHLRRDPKVSRTLYPGDRVSRKRAAPSAKLTQVISVDSPAKQARKKLGACSHQENETSKSDVKSLAAEEMPGNQTSVEYALEKIQPLNSFSTGGPTFNPVIDRQQAMENVNHQTTSTATSDADLLSRMLALLQECPQHVAIVKKKLGYVRSLYD